MCIVTDNKNNWFQEVKNHLLKRKHPQKITDYPFTKLFQPRKRGNNDKNVISYTRTYNPNQQLFFNEFKNYIEYAANWELQKAFNNKKVLFTTRLSKKLRNMLVWVKSEIKKIPKSPKLTELFLCDNCVCHKAAYIILFHHFHLK